MNEIKRILNFWKEVNLLTPVTVKSSAFKNQESLSVKEVLKFLITALKIHYF